MLSMNSLSFPAGRSKPDVLVALLFFFLVTGAAGWGQEQAATLQEDDRIGPEELFQLQLRWQTEASAADLNGATPVDQDDIFELGSQWHRPPVEGRAVGIYAVTEYGGEQFVSKEMEIWIGDSTDELISRSVEKPFPSLKTIDSRTGMPGVSAVSERVFDPAALASDPKRFEDLMMRLQGYDEANQMAGKAGIAAVTPQLGVATDKIGTFWGWTVWVGWDASWSETYIPEGESYAMVAYFAPEGVYFALQRSEFVYSGVDVFAGVGIFMGAAAFPGQEYFYKDTLGKSVTVSLSYGMTFTPTFSYGPTVSLSHGITFFQENKTPQHAIQLGVGSSVSLSLLPISLPASVSLGTSPPCEKPPTQDCGIFSGFWPIIVWAPAGPEGGSPLEKIITGLEELSVLPGNDFVSMMAREFGNTLLPIFYHLYTPEWVTLEDDVPPPDNAHYFTEFLQDPNPTSSSNTSISHLINEAGQWLQSSDTSGLGEAIKEQMQQDADLFYEHSKSIELGVNLGLELGEKHGYDLAVEERRRDDNKIFVEGIEVIPCPVGEWCEVVVTATEIAELYPGSQPGDFEGVWVRFDYEDALSTFYSGTPDSWDWVQIENGVAVHWYLMSLGHPARNGPFIHKDYNPIESKYIELQRRKIVPADRTVLYTTGKVLTGTSTALQCAALDGNGIPLTEGATVTFYDYRDMLIGTAVSTENGLASLDFVPKPSIPRIDGAQTTQLSHSDIEPTEEGDAKTTGFSLTGIGFSTDAELLMNGIFINDMSNWEWAVLSSKEILARPLEEQYRLTQTSTIQIINPQLIASNVFVYTP